MLKIYTLKKMEKRPKKLLGKEKKKENIITKDVIFGGNKNINK